MPGAASLNIRARVALLLCLRCHVYQHFFLSCLRASAHFMFLKNGTYFSCVPIFLSLCTLSPCYIRTLSLLFDCIVGSNPVFSDFLHHVKPRLAVESNPQQLMRHNDIGIQTEFLVPEMSLRPLLVQQNDKYKQIQRRNAIGQGGESSLSKC